MESVIRRRAPRVLPGSLISFPEAEGSLAPSHAEFENQLEERSRKVFRLLFQDHLTIRAEHEACIEDIGRRWGVRGPAIV